MHAISDMLAEHVEHTIRVVDAAAAAKKSAKGTFLIQCRCWVYTRLSTRGERLVFISRNGARCRCNISDSRCISEVQQCRPTLSHAFSPWKIESGILALTISFLFSLIITFFTVSVHLFLATAMQESTMTNRAMRLSISTMDWSTQQPTLNQIEKNS